MEGEGTKEGGGGNKNNPKTLRDFEFGKLINNWILPYTLSKSRDLFFNFFSWQK